MTGIFRFLNTSPAVRGALWKVSSFLFFSAINGIVRYLSQTSEAAGQIPLPAYEVAFFQNLFGLIFLIPWIVQQKLHSLQTHSPTLQFLRILLSAIGVVLWYISLTYMPLAQAVALMFLGPLITVIGAKIFLKERLSKERSLAILIGFVGGGIISHTTLSLGSITLAAILPILAATCFSGATLMVRRLAEKDSPQLIVTYLLVFMAPVLFIPTYFYGVWPELWQWPWLLIMGGCAAGAHLCLNHAYACAEVSYLAPYGFTKWFASTLIGLIAFAEIPSLSTCGGACILMAAILVLSYGDLRRQERSVRYS